MKQALFFSLKVSLTTFLLSPMLTFGVMMAYLKFMVAVSGYFNLSLNLSYNNVTIYCVTLFITLFLSIRYSKEIATRTRKNGTVIIGLAFITSIVIYFFNLLFSGLIIGQPLIAILITTMPMLTIASICILLFKPRIKAAVVL